MSNYPTPSAYQEALQAPEVAFDDPELQRGDPRTNILGLPQPITGAFAAVFPVEMRGGRTVGVKCFLKDIPQQQERYEAVSRHLTTVSLEALVSFEYENEGIRVNGTSYPILKMEWVEGTVLNRFAERHLDAPAILNQLAEAWAELMSALEGAQVAHGDLQHGNILVQEHGGTLALRLVDYDTMYVPSLEGWRSAEVGHRNFQHPDRTDDDFGPHLDRFPGLAIYTALRALVERPDLWSEFDTGENLLFRDDDFYDPDRSDLFERLAQMEPVADLVEALRTACYVDPADVPALDDVRAGRLEPASVTVARARRQRGRSTSERSPFANGVLPGLVALGGVTFVLATMVGPVLAASVAGAGILGLLGWALYRYRRLSLIRRRRRLDQERARFEDTIASLGRELDRLKKKREQRRTSINSLREERLEELQEESLYDALKHHFIGEVREVEGVIHKHVVRLKAANIRTAYEATPDAVANVRRISDEARAQINMWRAALVRKYEDRIPETLSPAEERRVQRYVEHQIENIDEQIARTKEKREVQRTERDRIQARLDDLPSFSFLQYVAYLLRLVPLPDDGTGAEDTSLPTGDASSSPTTPVPEPLPDDREWWQAGV